MIIYAVNVNSGGGKVLLDHLLEKAPFGKVTAAFIDHRYTPPKTAPDPHYFSIAPKIFTRLLAEFKLRRFAKKNPGETILFFGNLPPFFKLPNRSVLYLQNCFLTGEIPLIADSVKETIRLFSERLVVKLFSKNVDEIWVQSPWMQQITKKAHPDKKVELHPFLPELPPAHDEPKIYDYLFVGSVASNKRLSFFLQALTELDRNLTTPKRVAVVLAGSTPTELPKLKNIHLELKLATPREELFKIYSQSRVLVGTSLYESYFLPIYEALHFNLKVIVPDTGYSQDLDVIKFPLNSVQDLKTAMLNA